MTGLNDGKMDTSPTALNDARMPIPSQMDYLDKYCHNNPEEYYFAGVKLLYNALTLMQKP